MNTIYKESLSKDISKLNDKRVKTALLETIEQIKSIGSMSAIRNLKKIKGSKQFYCIKIGDYRLVIKIEENTVTFIRFLHRKEIYRFFP